MTTVGTCVYSTNAIIIGAKNIHLIWFQLYFLVEGMVLLVS